MPAQVADAPKVSAPLMVRKNGDERLWGVFAFVQLPAPGDRIRITENGRIQRLEVDFVAHEPLRAGEPEPPDRHSAWVWATWVDEYW